MDPTEMTVRQIVEATTTGSLTVLELVGALLRRIDDRDPVVQAWAHLDPARVILAARRLDASAVKGPLHGVPIGVKDVILTKDLPTRHNSPLYSDAVPSIDAACVQTLRAAGALVLGKTTTTEFAASQHGGPTTNPHDCDRTPGGSSSGSGAAVADRQVPLALGTQTGGSTIRPGAYNGIVAMKPTCGAVSREGIKSFAPSTDTVGFCVRDAADLHVLADVFRWVDRAPRTFNGLAGARIGVCRTPMWDAAQPETVAALATASDLLADAGAEVSELVLPRVFDGALDVFGTILRGEARVSFLHEQALHPDELCEEFRAFTGEGNPATGAVLVDAFDEASRLRTAFDRIAAPYDAVLTPSVPGEAPLGIGFTGEPVFCSMWSLLQAPVINVPGFIGPHGMPVGLSLVSPRYTDRHLVTVAEHVARLFQRAPVPVLTGS